VVHTLYIRTATDAGMLISATFGILHIFRVLQT
jgi:hypothetical protein